MIAEFHRNRSRTELQALISTVARLGAMLSVPLIIGVAVMGRWILIVFFGPEFAAAYPILLVVLLTGLQGALAGNLSGSVMSMTGQQESAAWIVAVSAAVYLILVAPLTGAFGAVGTALATLTAYSVRSIMLIWFIRNRLRINILPIPWPVKP